MVDGHRHFRRLGSGSNLGVFGSNHGARSAGVGRSARCGAATLRQALGDCHEGGGTRHRPSVAALRGDGFLDGVGHGCGRAPSENGKRGVRALRRPSHKLRVRASPRNATAPMHGDQ